MSRRPLWPRVLAALGLFSIILSSSQCGGGGGGGGGSTTGGGTGIQGFYQPTTFGTADLQGQGELKITPENGFTGQITVTLSLNISGQAGGFSPVPSTVQVTAPNSPVTLGANSIDTPIDFTWSSWSPGSYELIAILTGSMVTVKVPIEITVISGASPSTAVLTWHNDNMRTGANPSETILNQSTVTSATFGKLYSHLTTGPIMAEPLYMPDVAIAGKGTHNTVFVATMNSYVCAFDADNASGANSGPLWTANLGPAAPPYTGGGGDSYDQGIASTPVIDSASKTLYVVTKDGSVDSASFAIHALDIGSGAEKFGGPTAINAFVSGVAGGVGGVIILQPTYQYQRVGLLLLNGVVYVGIGGLNGDTPPDRGWIVGYNATTLQQVCVYTTAPDEGSGSQTADAGASIWMSGAGLASDGTYIYCATGNGSFNAAAGGHDYGDSVLKLEPAGGTLAIASYFSPFDQPHLSSADLDLGSGGPVLIPGGAIPLLVQVSKDGTIYVLNRNSLGGNNSTQDQVFQEFQYPGSGFWASPAYALGNVYFAEDGGPLTGLKLGSNGLSTSAFGSSAATFYHATPTVSYNAKAASPVSTSIVWIVSSGGNAVLHAYAGNDINELYNSGTSRDAAGGYIKFGVPTVANGKVYLPCSDGLYVYGTGNFGAIAHKFNKRANSPSHGS